MPFFVNLAVNWLDPVNEVFGFKTQIFSSTSGREVREARRTVPIWSYEFSVLVQREQHRKLVALMVTRRTEEVILASPTVFVRSTASALAGSDFIPLLEALRPAWMIPGVIVVIKGATYRITAVGTFGIAVEDYDSGVEGGVAGFSYILAEDGDYIVIEDDSAHLITSVPRPPFPIGTKIHLALFGRLEGTQDIRFLTSRVGTARVRFLVSSDVVNPYIRSDFEYAQFGGLDLFDFRINWADPSLIRYDQQRETYQSETGPESFFWKAVPSVRYWTTPHTAKTHEEARRAVTFFVDKRGRAKTFFYSAVASELELAEPVSGGSYDVVFAGTDLSLTLETGQDTQFLVFETRFGDIFRLVLSVSEVDGNSEVTLRDPLPISLQPSDVRAIRAVMQARFAEDTLDVTWLTDGKAQIEMKTRSIDYIGQEVSLLLAEDDDYIVIEDDSAHIATEV